MAGYTKAEIISIHALLAESDGKMFGKTINGFKFLSTLSLRRATPQQIGADGAAEISIHALLAESDLTGVSTIFRG